MQKIILGTSNLEKVEDIVYALNAYAPNEFSSILTLADIKLTYGIDIPDADENGKTVEENCMSKVITYKNELGKIEDLHGRYLISEDTGLFIRELDWNPGVHTARFAGDHDFNKLGKKVMELMNGVKDRYAFVKSAVGLTVIGEPEISTKMESSYVEGSISDYIYEGKGFAFDKIFCMKGYKCTVAELSNKNRVHRLGIPRFICIEELLNRFLGR